MLVGWLAPAVDRAAILADLDEGFFQHRSARRYWIDAVASLLPLVRLRWRRAAPFTDLPRDFRDGFRLMRDYPGLAAAAILTMVVGAGVATVIASLVDAVLLRHLPYANQDRLVVLQEWDTKGSGSGSRVLRSLLFGVTMLDLPSLAAVLAILAAVIFAACAVPARRAVTLPVTTALRAD